MTNVLEEAETTGVADAPPKRSENRILADIYWKKMELITHTYRFCGME